ncbi:MAG TPA: amidohydrolase family protein [Hanamia sp.]|nr:amidohydrolase family protein [Hanamia sp.]
MMRIDAHQHFWNYDPYEHNWMTDEMHSIKKNFLPEGLNPLLQQFGISGTFLVQVSQSYVETGKLLTIAENNDFVKGVVGWVDLLDKNIHDVLDHYKKYARLKGFRHILQTEEPDFMLQKKFLNGISALKGYDFTYDILIYPKHLESAVRMVEKFPEQRFVVDHIAKPDIKNKKLTDWRNGIQLLASFPNVYCKISGMVTEADWHDWEKEDFIIYLDEVINSFGIGRVMFGSDWPMCLVAASYGEVLNIVSEYFASFSQEEQELFFSRNAMHFYGLQ